VTSDLGLSLIFVTHSTSTDNEAGIASGWSDPDLSATGEEQARELGARYAEEPIDLVVASDLRRAVRTADIAFGGRDLECIVDERLRECSYGELDGAPREEVEAVRLDCIDEPFPAGESYREATERHRSLLAELAEERPGATILLIGHRATHHALAQLCEGVPLEESLVAPYEWQPGWRFRYDRRV
jgi:broad specificity phosphatase PhoE